MIQQGSDFQFCDIELVNYMEHLCAQKIQVDNQIEQLMKDKIMVQKDIEMLTHQLENIRETLAWKSAIQKELDSLLVEGLFTYDQILESSKMLLSVLEEEIQKVDHLIALKIQLYELLGSD
ncbi:hypothetical protein E2320_001637 [Naja naja]|uniref:Uncharacterized protein n=1 Tax=Naja naja TaxID=35670 RepID=A0A8C6Y9K5_NAJNA|nr:hypothetical protein E2320_001637 [Naja naja]